MSRIDELIAQLCPQGVEVQSLGDAVVIKTGPNINKNVIADRPGPYPVINSGRDPLGYIDNFNTENDPIGIASRGSVGLVTWTPGRFFRGNLNYSCTVKNPVRLDVRFLYHYLLHADADIQGLATHQGIPALNAGALKTLRVPIPPLEIQREIVKVLDTFTALEAELEAELEARRRQYQYYRDALLTFGERTDAKASKQARITTLGEIGSFMRGTGLQKSDFTETGVGCIHYGQIHTHYGTWADETLSFISPEFAARLRKARTGDLVIATTSEDDGAVAKAVAWLGVEEVAVSTDAYIFRHTLNPKYVSYFFQTEQFQQQKKPHITGTKVRRISGESLAKIRIPVPSDDEQTRIVSILDQFDALVNDLSSGLPAEIKARRQQYAHYRDRLLTFKMQGRV